jgi:uncharacterized membrane protein YjgN (DUF898 family)
MSKQISFTGSFGEYFIMSLGLMLLSIITLGLAIPYWIYWSFKYFFSKLEIDGKTIVFTGGFWEYFIISLGLMLLTSITLGLAMPYWFYWSLKYFFTKMEVQE